MLGIGRPDLKLDRGNSATPSRLPRGRMFPEDRYHDRSDWGPPRDEMYDWPRARGEPFPPDYRARDDGQNISYYDPTLAQPRKRPPMNEDIRSSKKARAGSDYGDDTPPSRVLFIRNMPADVTEAEVATLAVPFGVLTNMVLTRNAGFGLLELMELPAAEDMVDYYSRVCPPKLRGKGPISVTFSRYPNLQTTPPNHQICDAISNANKRFLASTNQDFSVNPRTVLRAQLFEAPSGMHFGYRYFYQLFCPFGRLLRIVTFKSGAVPNAFVEFDDPVAAHVAVLQMDGNSVSLDDRRGSQSCLLRVDFSYQPTVEVHTEDANCRDFTRNPMLDDELPHGVPAPRHNDGVEHYGGYGGPDYLPAVDILDQLTEERLLNFDPAILSELASRLVKPLIKAALHVGGQQGLYLKSQVEALERLAPRLSGPPIPQNAAGLLPMDDDARGNVSSPVLYVSNLCQERVTPDTLFMLFGNYGNVLRVKILHGKKDCALIQFDEPSQAQAAVTHLDNVPLFGKRIRCTVSRNMVVTIPTPGSDDSEASAANIHSLNREYLGHRLHRFRRGQRGGSFGVCPPSKVLHVSNLPAEIAEDDLTDVFERVGGCEPMAIKLIKSSKPTALVELPDLEKAISALVALHDYEISDKLRIRVGFTKATIPSKK